MEMNSNLIEIQGLLKSIVKTTGDFTKIKYKGGNEMKINHVIKELEDYLISKEYINKRISNKSFYKELDDITFFFAINLDFKDKSIIDIKEFTHLINVIPTLSKCLVANIVTELDLNEYYCNTLQKLPAELSEELLCEIVPCIKKSKTETSLALTYIYVKNIIRKISSIDTSNPKMIDCIEKLEDTSFQIILNCSGINPDQTQGWKKKDLYKYMGQTLLCLLKLLQHCQVENEVLFKIIDDLINSICSLMRAVTVDVFCAWVEVDYNNEILQTVIAEKAYQIIEKYQKYEPARRLIQMLGSIAKKPKSLNEMILEASTATMILKIEQNAINRNKWFAALLNTQVFQNKEVKECVYRWANLCTIEDLERLLSLSVNHKEEEDVIEIIMRCASCFNEEELAMIMTRFFYEYGLNCCLRSKNTLQQLTVTLNKLEKTTNKEPVKDVLLLLLQDPEVVLTVLYKNCIKNEILLQTLEGTFKIITEIIAIEKLFLRVLDKLIEEDGIDSNNVTNYENLLKVIAKTNYKKLVHNFLMPHVRNYLKEARYDDLNYAFHIYKEIVNKTCPEELDQLIQISVNILEKCRWKIFDFTYVKSTICETAIQVLLDCKDLHYTNITEENILSLQHTLNKYYISQLDKKFELDFLAYVCPNLKFDEHAECVGYLIKLLPICTPKEWIFITYTLLKRCTPAKVLEIITDTLIIICQVVQTQLKTDNGCILNGLKFCIQNYGIFLKDLILAAENEEANVVLVKSICRLLREIPTEIVDVEGLSLIGLMPDTTLKGLTQDENFLCILLSMNGSEPSRIIAKKMLT